MDTVGQQLLLRAQTSGVSTFRLPVQAGARICRSRSAGLSGVVQSGRIHSVATGLTRRFLADRAVERADPVFARRVSSAIFLGKVANASRPRGCVRSAAGPAPCWGAHAGTVGAGTKEKVVVSGSQARNSRGSSRQTRVDRIFDIASTVSRRTALWGPEDGRHQAPVKAADLFAHSHFAKTIFRTRIALPRNPQAGRVERKRASAPFQGLPTLILHA